MKSIFFCIIKSFAALAALVALLVSSTGLRAEQTAGVKVHISQSSVSMSSLGKASFTVTATPENGTVIDVSASKAAIESGLPHGIIANWGSPKTSVGGAVTWQLALTGSKAAKGASTTLHLNVQVKDTKKGAVLSDAADVNLSVALVPPTLSFTPAASQVSVVQGTSGTDLFTLQSGGSFSGYATLAVSGLPSGVTPHWASNPVDMSTSKGTANLTLQASVDVPPMTYPFTVTATGVGVSVTQSYSVVVEPTAGIRLQTINSVSMSSMGSVTTGVSAVSLAGVTAIPGGQGCTASIISGLPTGVTANWTQPSTASAGTVQWKLTLTGSPLALGSNPIITLAVSVTDAATGIVFTVNQSFPLAVKFTAPSLNFSAASNKIFVAQGASLSNAFTFSAGGSFHGAVNLSVSGLPSGATATWSQNPLTLTANAGTSILTISTTSSVAARGYSLTVIASADGLTISRSFTIAVEPTAGLSLALSNATLRMVPGASASMTVTAQTMSGVIVNSNGSGAIAQVSSLLPTGLTAKWSQPTVTNSGNLVTWQLTLSSTTSAPGGLYPTTITTTLTDQSSGMQFSANQQFSLVVGLLAQVSVGTTPGIAVPSEFMGLSHEWVNTYRFMGSPAVGVNQIYRQLLNNLTAYGSDPINIRMGGNSTDTSVMPTATTDAPLADLAKSLHSKFILGINLGSDNLSLAEAQAQNDVSEMPSGSIEGLEIGNEPDLYYKNGTRPSTYSFSDYLADIDNWKNGINPLLPSGVKLAGPTWSAYGNWIPQMPAFLADETPSLSVVTEHNYVTSPYSNAPIDVLILPSGATQGPLKIAPEVVLAHANGLKFRMDEIGAVDDQGIEGVSDAFGSALWAVDTMFEYVNVGVDGVNWETSGGNNVHPFYFETETNGNSTTYYLTSVSPLYYGMLLFQQATANHSHLLPASVNTTANFKCWATVDANGTNRLTLINKDENQSGSVMVSMPGYSVATITWLTAPSFTSTSGVTIGGQTFETSLDGTIQGAPALDTVQGNNGVFTIQMPITSAAMVVFSN